MKNLKSQSGRSMVEMLGVLAIIGVLSIGGIAGYTMAMSRYKANEVLNAAQMLSVVAQTGVNKTGAVTETLESLGVAGADENTLHNCVLSATYGSPEVKVEDATGATCDLTTIGNITGKTHTTVIINADGQLGEKSDTTTPNT